MSAGTGARSERGMTKTARLFAELDRSMALEDHASAARVAASERRCEELGKTRVSLEKVARAMLFRGVPVAMVLDAVAAMNERRRYSLIEDGPRNVVNRVAAEVLERRAPKRKRA